VSIISTTLNGNYASFSGTAMAALHVAGVATLLWSTYPSRTNQQVRTILTQTANDLGAAGIDEYFGYGKVNAQNTVLPNFDFDTTHPKEPYLSISGIHSVTITRRRRSWSPDSPPIPARAQVGTPHLRE
jgi:subtilisin family serine protease